MSTKPLTSVEVAEYFQRTEATVKRWIRDHKIPYYAAGQTYLLADDAIALLKQALVVSSEEKRERREAKKAQQRQKKARTLRSTKMKESWEKRKASNKTKTPSKAS